MVEVEPASDATLHSPIAPDGPQDHATARQGKWRQRFAAYEAKAFTLGEETGR